MNFQLLLSFLITIFIIPTRVLAQQNDIYCYGTDRERSQTNHFATKTTYERAKGSDSEYRKDYQIPHCVPQKIWYLSRHGTRLPPVKIIKRFPELESIRARIMENSEQKRTKLCMEDVYQFRTWKLNKSITEDHALYLTNKAKEDIKLIARKHHKLLSATPNIDVLPKHYDPKYYLFRHTDTERTESSFRAFAEGLFDKFDADAIVLPKPQKPDKILEPYRMCDDYKKNEMSLRNEDSEVIKFENSDIMQRTVQEISERLGFRGVLELNEVQLMWDMCRHEEAWRSDKASAWCAAFTASHVDVLEYAEDLKYYYQNGYGYDKGSKVACGAVKDMLLNLNDTNTDPHATFYFGHSEIIQLFLNAMGFKKDATPLTSSNYLEMKYRKWRTSQISPFTANFVAVKYSCQGDPKVMFFLNQVAITDLQSCDVGLCSWSTIMNHYENILNHNCDEYFCYGSSSSIIKLSISLLLMSCIYFIALSF